MTATNDITGDPIKTKAGNSSYGEGWDRIFKKKMQDYQDATLDNIVQQNSKNETRKQNSTDKG
jgi:hypothetical protein